MHIRPKPKWTISYSTYHFILFLVLVTFFIVISWFLAVIQYEQLQVFGKYLVGTTAYDIRSYLLEISVFIDYIREFNIQRVLFSSYGPIVTLLYSLPILIDKPLLFAIINGLLLLITLTLISSINKSSKAAIILVLLHPYYLISIWGPSKDILALFLTIISFYIINKHDRISTKPKIAKFTLVLFIIAVIAFGVRANITLAILGFIFFYIIKHFFKLSRYISIVTFTGVSLLVHLVFSLGLKDIVSYQSMGSNYIPSWIQNATPLIKLILMPIYILLYGLWDYIKPLPLFEKQIDLVYLSLSIGGIFVIYSVILIFLQWKKFVIPNENLYFFTSLYLLVTIQNAFIHPRYLYPLLPCIILLSKIKKIKILIYIATLILFKLFISSFFPLTGQRELDASLPYYLPYNIFSFH